MTAPATKGFGFELIEREVRHELGSEVELEFPATGIVVRVAFPWKAELFG